MNANVKRNFALIAVEMADLRNLLQGSGNNFKFIIFFANYNYILLFRIFAFIYVFDGRQKECGSFALTHHGSMWDIYHHSQLSLISTE